MKRIRPLEDSKPVPSRFFSVEFFQKLALSVWDKLFLGLIVFFLVAVFQSQQEYRSRIQKMTLDVVDIHGGIVGEQVKVINQAVSEFRQAMEASRRSGTLTVEQGRQLSGARVSVKSARDTIHELYPDAIAESGATNLDALYQQMIDSQSLMVRSDIDKIDRFDALGEDAKRLISLKINVIRSLRDVAVKAAKEDLEAATGERATAWNTLMNWLQGLVPFMGKEPSST